MRDLQRLEKLSSTAALGLWADDVVLALDRATSSHALDTADIDLLNDAAEMLDTALQRTENPFTAPSSARALAATDTTLTIAATLAREQTDIDEHGLLTAMAAILRKAADGSLSGDDDQRVDRTMKLFGLLGEHQLIESNSVLTSRQDAKVWTEIPTT
jgi:hypothetical protein